MPFRTLDENLKAIDSLKNRWKQKKTCKEEKMRNRIKIVITSIVIGLICFSLTLMSHGDLFSELIGAPTITPSPSSAPLPSPRPIEGYVIVSDESCALFETASIEDASVFLPRGTLLLATNTTYAQVGDWELANVVVKSGEYFDEKGFISITAIESVSPEDVAKILNTTITPTMISSPTPHPKTVEELSTPFASSDNIQLNGYDKATDTYTYLQLGTYKEEPIIWRILEANETEALLLSENILEIMRFDSDSVAWTDSDINTWLNKTFIRQAFNDFERSLIFKKNNLEPIHLLSIQDLTNPEYGFDANPNNNDLNRSSVVTEIIRNDPSYKLHLYNGNRSIYYTRDRASDPDCIAAVKSTGIIGSAALDRKYNDVGVRPALWIHTNSLQITSGSGRLDDPYQ